MMMVNGCDARKRMLLAVTSCSMEEGGEYWTSESAKSGGRPVWSFVEGTNPVSSYAALELTIPEIK